MDEVTLGYIGHSVSLVHLYHPCMEKVTLHLPAIARIKASIHHMVDKRSEDIVGAHKTLISCANTSSKCIE
jgi:hypothetical protein